ncbi:MAG TPA: Trx7/PDZ domain-containing (seleno)protein [Verrucomicrobiae bacterium]|nr:Trx7/PDZ domain-containing (seleno)protein [Verrucomicrobiae bacterium]
MACAGFDGQVVRHDTRIEDLLKRFVCVRLVQANDLDLTLFQFDYDLTFAAFFMNADRTIYGRFGSRSDQKNAEKDISLEGFRKALAAALELHKAYPKNKAILAGKQPLPTPVKRPEEYASLAGKYKPTIDYESKPAASCMHCHQVREAERVSYRNDNKPIPDQTLYPWPMPAIVGLTLDPKEKAKVTDVAPGSAAALARFQAGDEILTLDRQPIISTADVQWVLHHSVGPTTVDAVVRRQGKTVNLKLALPKDWRVKTDIAWRATTWDLRRMALGGLVLKHEPGTNMALRVDYVGQYGDHATGKRAGFKKDDVIVRVDNESRSMTESELFRFLLQNKSKGDKVPVTVLRSGEAVDLTLPMQ